MSLKAARPAEFPVTDWETFEGETHGYNEAGDRIVEISAAVRQTMWATADNNRGWAVFNEDNDIIGYGTAEGLRAAKAAAVKALNA